MVVEATGGKMIVAGLAGDVFNGTGEMHTLETDFKGLDLNVLMQEKYSISKKLIEREYFNNNKSQEEIAKSLGISQWVISNRMREYGLKPRERTWKIGMRKYSVDDYFFEEINHENAWVLGWLASDGFVNEDGNSLSFGIKVSKKDSDIIKKIKELLQYNGKTYNVKCKLKKTGKEYEQLHLKITSKKIVSRLREFGIVKNKTNKLDFPKLISETNDEEIIKNFIQGVFEGDGSVLFDEKTSSPCFQIVGTKELLSGIQLQLMKHLNLKKTKLTRNVKNSNHFALRYRGRFQAMKIFDWLYSNPKYFLDRKYNRYLDIKRRLNLCAD